MIVEIGLGEVTGLELAPGVERDAEGASSGKTGHEAGHGGKAVVPVGISKIWSRSSASFVGRVDQVCVCDDGLTMIVYDMALRLEFLDGDFRVLWKEQDIPILVTHSGDGIHLFLGNKSIFEAKKLGNGQRFVSVGRECLRPRHKSS